MSNRIRRDLHKRIGATGYQQIAGDIEVQGNMLGPEMTNMAAAIAVLAATTTTPVQLAPPQPEGVMRGINIFWSKQYNLKNLSHYELQVSEDQMYWYSLKSDGTTWKDVLNEDTDVKVEFFNHANIPLEQSGGDLVGKTLYYRVRQATLADEKSPWSEAASATTKAVTDLVLTDSRYRYIEISSHKGLYADDRQGHIIHDIPDAPILTDMVYGGHIIWKDAPDYISGIVSLDYTDGSGSVAASSAITNINLSAFLPGDLTNIKGILAYIQHDYYVAVNKTGPATLTQGTSLYSTTYNAISSSFNLLHGSAHQNVPASYVMNLRTTGTSLIPCVFNAGIPYVTWRLTIVFDGMQVNTGRYYLFAYMFLLGFIV